MSNLIDPKEALDALVAGQIAPQNLYAAIHSLGHGPAGDAKPYVERFLHHADPQLRYIALNVLTIHWKCHEHRRTCERFAQEDPDSDNRRIGVSGLAALLESTRDASALRFLLDIFQNDAEEHHIRDAAYSSILYVLGAPVKDQPRLTRLIDFDRDVKWEWIAKAEGLAES